ncbi:MAG: hypothetical protein NQ127_04340, partial [Candidatus Cardinium sp.]|nr:hypothetical protein [Candidatus Cardinium sp.]
AGNCNKSKVAASSKETTSAVGKPKKTDVPNQKKLENIVQLAGNCNKSKVAGKTEKTVVSQEVKEKVKKRLELGLAGNCNKTKVTGKTEKTVESQEVKEKVKKRLELGPVEMLQLALKSSSLFPLINRMEKELKTNLKKTLDQKNIGKDLRQALGNLYNNHLNTPLGNSADPNNYQHHLKMPLSATLFNSLMSAKNELIKSISKHNNASQEELLRNVELALKL